MPKLFSAAARKLSLRRHNTVLVSPGHASSIPLRHVAIHEQLEDRRLFSVALNDAGFTVVTPNAADRTVYVSNSTGSDSNPGLSPSAPVKTLAKAKALVRNGTSDQLLLLRGDTWHENFGYWAKTGRSADEPMVIGAYGVGDRPVVASGAASALAVGSSSNGFIDHLVIQGIKFWADTRDPASPTFTGTAGSEGVRLLASTTDLLMEDCAVDSYKTNVTASNYFGPASNIRIRRCQITDAYNTAGHAQGIYAEKLNGLTLEENVFDHNGWNTAVSGAGQTMYNHNAYIKETVDNFVARGNLFSNASSHGMQARGGGIIDNNTFINNPIALSYGQVNGAPVKAGGVFGQVTNNTIFCGGSIAGSARGWGIEIGNTMPGGNTVVSGNVFANAPANSGYAIYLNYGNGVTNQSQAVGINDLTIEGNVVYNWTRALYINTGLVSGATGYKALNNVTIRNNDFQRTQSPTVMYVGAGFSQAQVHVSGNRYHSSGGSVKINNGYAALAWATWAAAGNDSGSACVQVTYLDPTRTAGVYATPLGVGSSDGDYVQQARQLSSANWSDALTGAALSGYVRDGFTPVTL